MKRYNFNMSTCAAVALLALMTAGANAQTKIGGTIGAADPNAYLQLGDAGGNKGLLLPRVTLSATNLAAPLTAHKEGMAVYNTATAGTGITAVTPGYYYNDGTKWVRSVTGAANWYKAGTTAAAINADHQYVTGNIGIGGHNGANNDNTYNFSANNPSAPLVVVAPGNATDTAATAPATGMRLVMPGVYGYKWPVSADFQIGSYATGLAAASKLDIRLGNGGAATPDVTVASFLGNGNVGIGTTAPKAKLEVAGQVKITGGTPGINKVLTSDSTGLATWQTAATDGDAWGVNGEDKITNINRTGIVRLGTATSGSIELVPGSATQSGYLGIYKSNGTTRLGYMGFDNNNLTYVTENGAHHVFTGTGNVGVGTATPGAKLEVAGQVKITGGTPGAGKVLTSDATGLATWQPAANSWLTTGNAGTTAPTALGTAAGSSSYAGTSTAQNFAIATNGITRAIFSQNGTLTGGSTGTISSGSENLVWGKSDTVSGNQNLVSGERNIVSTDGNFVSGLLNKCGGYYSGIIGGYNTIAASPDGTSFNTTIGDGNRILGGDANAAFGVSNLITGGAGAGYNFLFGRGNSDSSDIATTNFLMGYQNRIRPNADVSRSAAFGYDNEFSGTCQTSILMGSSNKVSAVTSVFALGQNITLNGASSGLYANTINSLGNVNYGGSLVSTSDRRFKSNFKALSYGLNTVMQMKPLEYEQLDAYRVENGKPVTTDKGYTGSHHSMGFIAQDLYNLVPEAVSKPANEQTEKWGVDYVRLVPVLTRAIQEQQAEIETLKAAVKALQNK